MKRNFIIFLLLTLMALTAQANPVDMKSAQEVGSKFLQANTSLKVDVPSDLQCISTYRTADGIPAFYVFNHAQGFVLVSADDCALPILGYSDEGPFDPDNHPVQMEDYLQRFVAQIHYGIDNHLEADEETVRQWDLVKSTGYLHEDRSTTVVEPLITAIWGQGCYYNNLCPTDYQGPCEHALVGCVAVAMGQIMHFWGYPETGNGSHTYVPVDGNTYLPSGYPTQTANFGATTYNWSAMPNELTAASSSTQMNAVATLLWHCGVSVEMMYGPNASGAFSSDVPYALMNYFRYASDLELIYHDYYNTNQWLNLIKSSLDMGRPVYYSGVDTQGQGGHAFICDGYDANNLLHINWGWYGNQNNYFADGALNVSVYQFNDYVNAIINIHPNYTGNSYQITATANPTQGGTVSGGGIYYEGQPCTLTATPNADYTFTNWTLNGAVVSTNPSFTFNVTENASYVANFTYVSVETGLLGYTTYDWQSNAGARTWTHVWPDGKVSFAFTTASNTSFTDRGTGIGTYNVANDTWTASGGRVEAEKTGFGSIAQYGSNGIVVAAHTATDCRIYTIFNKDNIPVNGVTATSVLNNTYGPCWPAVMTSGPNRNIIHVVATANSGVVPGMESVTQPVIYFRSTDGGVTWDKQNLVLPFMDANYCLNWSSNKCYWMETTDDNCLALVVNNAWSDGMVLYSYDDGETWQRKVFYKHPNPFGSFDDTFYYPRWTSCQWDSQHHLHVLYEYNGSTGNPGSGSYYPSIGGVAYWNETMPYNLQGNTQSDTPGNLIPGQPFVIDNAYLYNDIHASTWYWSDATHEMWPEYIGYLPPLTDNGNPENPYEATSFHFIENNSFVHGSYNSGLCAFPVLCMVPGTDEMVAVWSALDENHTDVDGYYYYKLFASYSNDGGASWSPMVHLTNISSCYNAEFVYNQAAVVGRKLIIASQTDAKTGSFVQNDDDNAYDNYYKGFVFDIDELFATEGFVEYNITVQANPASAGTVTGGGTYLSGTTCTINATPNPGYYFVNWTQNGNEITTNPNFSFIVTNNSTYVANFVEETSMFDITTLADPSEGGIASGGGTYQQGAVCTLIATPNSGYLFVNWTKNGNVVSTSNSFSFNVTENATYVAHFEEEIVVYNITALADPAEGGVVSGSGYFAQGLECTLTATPNSGYVFLNWTKNGNIVSNSPSFSFNVIENATYIAHFHQIYSITVGANPTEGGVVTGGGTYLQGEVATVIVIPNPNYEFLSWTENGVEVSTATSYSFVVTGNRQLVANLSFVDAVGDVTDARVMLFPNPAHDRLTVECEEPIRQYEVFSLTGDLVIQTKDVFVNQLELDVKALPAGVYLLRLTSDRAVLTRRFVKQ